MDENFELFMILQNAGRKHPLIYILILKTRHPPPHPPQFLQFMLLEFLLELCGLSQKLRKING